MLTVNDLMKPQIIMPKYSFVSNLGELFLDNTDSREARQTFLRNYGHCRITEIKEYNHFLNFIFRLPQCPIFDIECPYAYTEGLNCQCYCDNPFDECDEMQFHMLDLDTRNYKGE